jgi:catechol 2,3-dioxygenase-like lactoylglutathione lyase family enzyme
MDDISIRRLEFVTIYTRDLERARHFWVTMLGCKILRESPKEFVQIEIGGVPICIDLLDSSASGQSNNIGVLVDDLEKTTTALRGRGLEVNRGFNPLSLERWVGVKDFDGNELTFLTPGESKQQ